ncbi:MAG: M28 family peptidase [Candidatus Eisenbacteria bacterium]|nr:M28 family peptidase [Candidatus Eisenbacteria bacterium]
MARVAVWVVVPVIALSALGCGDMSFDGESAYGFVERQCEFGTREPGGTGHERMLEWLVDTLDGYADQVALQSFKATMWDSTDVTLTNVIASFRTDLRRRVLLCAHWDTRPVAERDPNPDSRGRPIPGANDGASGVAVLLELGRMMAERAPSVGVDLVFFDGEDGGQGGGLADFCLGSAYYAAHMGSYAPSYAVVIDMIGDRDLSIPVEPNSMAACPEVVEMVWSAADAVGAGSFTRSSGTGMFDDHIPLIRAGVPTALVIDFDYAHWHTQEDTPDKVSAESLGEVGKVLSKLVY